MQKSLRRGATFTLSWLACAALSSTSWGQNISLPRVSPHATVTQTIGLTDITIDYHSPAVKGRAIWGELVPYNEVWRAGANDNTTMTFEHDVKLNGKPVPAGTYGLHMIPTEGDWTVILSANHTSWGSFSYDQAEDVARITATPRKAEHAEWLRYGFRDLTSDEATAYLQWEKLLVPFTVSVDVHEVVLANAQNELRSLPGFSWQAWNQIARYAITNNVHLDDALGWVDRSIRNQANFQNQRTKALLLEKLGRGSEADALMETALRGANEADINVYGYEFLQAGNHAKAIQIFKKNIKEHPKSWNAHDSLAEAFAANDERKNAIQLYKAALALAPDNQHARIRGALERLESKR